jgi:type IV pilus assembly protein PilQ
MKRSTTIWLVMTWLVTGMPQALAGHPAAIPARATPESSTPSKTAGGPALVSDVLIRPGSDGEVTIDVTTTKSATFHVYRLGSPDRLVLDVEGMRNAVRLKLIPVSSSVVKDVPVGQFREKDPEVVRVVADLSGHPVFDTHAYPGGLRLEVKPRTVAVSRAVAPPTASTTVTAAKRDELKPDYRDTLPASEGSRGVAAAPRPVPQAATPEALKAERAAQVLNPETASNLPAAQSAVPTSLAPPRKERPAYTGELISLDLKDVDLKDFFRLIHEISGLNINVDPNVAGSVTTVLDNVPWDQALDIVLRNNGLGKTLEGNVLRIARLDALESEQEMANRLAATRIDAAPMVTIFRPVNYAKASAIATLFKTWAAGKTSGGALSRRGSVMVDERTNTLIISDIASQIPIIQGILTKLDTKTKQVAIEARIVLASSSFQRTLSAALVGAISNRSGSTIGAGQTGSGASVTPSTTTSPPTFTLPSNATAGLGAVAITNFSERYLIDAAISAAEIRSQAKTISRPSIITQNNVEGMVQQGTQIPVQTSINNTISVTYVNATLQLMVTPQVTDDGHIFLKIVVQNASPGTIITGAAVSINIQQANTQVLVPDGGPSCLEVLR